jgi:hypothetical protein
MSTKTPLPPVEFPPDSIEKISYAIAAEIPSREPNDNIRLGYHIWAYLKERVGTLEDAVLRAGVRSELTRDEICRRIRKSCEKRGIPC